MTMQTLDDEMNGKTFEDENIEVEYIPKSDILNNKGL